MAQRAHAERKHSKWNSSGASRWTVCFGQPNKCENLLERPPTKYNIEGTAAHETLELCVEAFAAGQDHSPSRFTNSPATIQSCAIVMDYLARLRAEYPDLIVEGERRVWFPQDHVKKEECGGTLDIFAYSRSTRRVWIIDFKHGEGVPVEVVGNEQLLSYACARLWPGEIDYAEITLTVIQPRCRHRLGPVREWEITAIELIEFVHDVDAALAIGSRPDAPLVPGEHCRWCPAEHVCEAREKMALEGMQQNFAHLKDLEGWQPPAPASLPIERMLAIYKATPQIKAWLDAIETRLIAAAVHEAVELPGYKVVEALSRRKFLPDGKMVADKLMALSNGRLGLDDVFPRKLITITEADARLVGLATADAAQGWKEAAARAMRDQIATLTDRKSSGNLTLAASDDARPATSAVAQQFQHVALALAPPQPAPALEERNLLMFGALPAPVVDPKTLIQKG